jgi:5-methylcytosine-specific restriction protein A
VKVCNIPGCPELTTSSRCPAHQSQARKESDGKRPNSSARGYDSKWSQTRRAFLTVHPFCECGARATEADHDDGLGPLGPRGHDWENLTARCKSCHSKRTAKDQPGGWNR